MECDEIPWGGIFHTFCWLKSWYRSKSDSFLAVPTVFTAVLLSTNIPWFPRVTGLQFDFLFPPKLNWIFIIIGFQLLTFPFYLCRTRTLVLELLAAVCFVSGGHEIILRAFDNFKTVTGESRRFETLLHYYQYEDFHIGEFSCYVVILWFVNENWLVIIWHWYVSVIAVSAVQL